MWPYNINCYKFKSNNIELKVMRNKKVTFQISGTTQKGALFGLLLNFKKQLLHIVAPPPQFHWVITGALGTAHVRNGWHCSMNHTRASLCLEKWRLFLAVWWSGGGVKPETCPCSVCQAHAEILERRLFWCCPLWEEEKISDHEVSLFNTKWWKYESLEFKGAPIALSLPV